jgi:hypothetical protein
LIDCLPASYRGPTTGTLGNTVSASGKRVRRSTRRDSRRIRCASRSKERNRSSEIFWSPGLSAMSLNDPAALTSVTVETASKLAQRNSSAKNAVRKLTVAARRGLLENQLRYLSSRPTSQVRRSVNENRKSIFPGYRLGAAIRLIGQSSARHYPRRAGAHDNTTKNPTHVERERQTGADWC